MSNRSSTRIMRTCLALFAVAVGLVGAIGTAGTHGPWYGIGAGFVAVIGGGIVLTSQQADR